MAGKTYNVDEDVLNSDTVDGDAVRSEASRKIHLKTTDETSGGHLSVNLRHLKLGEVMVSLGMLKRDDINRVLASQQVTGLPFGECAVRLGLVSQKQLEQAVAYQFGFSYPLAASAALSDDLATIHEPFSPYSEALRAIGNRLMQQWATPERKILAVTSAGSREGRSFLSANLAVVLAHSGRRTLLVDGDLRNPTLHETFGVSRHPGFSRLLSGFASPDTAFRVPWIRNLTLIAAGPVPPDPLELLSRPALDTVFLQARKHYDVVIVDTPCSSAFADAETISVAAGSALVVAAENRTRSRAMRSWISRLSASDVYVAGSVMNAVE